MSCLASEGARVLKAGADYLHLDVMDGHFVPNLTFGAPVIKSLRKHFAREEAVFDVHLMVTDPLFWVDDMAEAGADIFTFHADAAPAQTAEIIAAVKGAGMQVGLAVNPDTGVETLWPHLDQLDQVLVMTVQPGFGGQSFKAEMLDKVAAVRERDPSITVEVDGGLGPGNINAAVEAGANMIVAGSSIFQGDPEANLQALRDEISSTAGGGPGGGRT